jgi:hypothetical protein
MIDKSPNDFGLALCQARDALHHATFTDKRPMRQLLIRILAILGNKKTASYRKAKSLMG